MTPTERFSVARMIRMHHESVTEGVKHVQELEEWFDEELKCEAKHQDQNNLVCSGEVTHRYWSCDRHKFVCSNSAAYVAWVLSAPERQCSTCREPVGSHWDLAEL